ncbi:MAG: hypothetical protein R3D67_17650 [Hyphomicrobiaceae bacterium]
MTTQDEDEPSDPVGKCGCGRHKISYSLFGAFVALALSCATGTAVQAQSREILLGTVTTGSDASRHESGRAAAQLLAEGLAALERGDVMLGRRHLQLVIDRYPENLAAQSARRDLQRTPRLNEASTVGNGFLRTVRRRRLVR